MNVPNLINTINRSEIGESLLCDDHNEIHYSQISDELDKLNLHFTTKSIFQKNSVVEYYCSNTIWDVLLILYFFDKKISFVIMNSSAVSADSGGAILHDFCTHKVSVNCINSNNGSDNIEELYNITVNQNSIKAQPGIGNGNILLLTSGSTGKPKLVIHDSNALILNSLNVLNHFKINSSNKTIITVPIYHLYGFGAALIPSLLAGASIRLVKNTNIISYIQAEQRFLPDITYLTPSLCEMLLKIKKSKYEYKLMVTAGDKIMSKIMLDCENKFGKIVNLYGSTELGVIATSSLSEDISIKSTGAITPLKDVELKFEKSSNELSKIYCKHPYSFKHYLTYDFKTKKYRISTRHEWHDTGDITRKGISDSSFKIVGRHDNCINRKGKLVSLDNLELQIKEQIKKIKEVILFTTDNENLVGKEMIMICSLHAGISITPDQIREECFDVFERAHCPDRVIILKHLDKTPTGKIDRVKMFNTHIGKQKKEANA